MSRRVMLGGLLAFIVAPWLLLGCEGAPEGQIGAEQAALQWQAGRFFRPISTDQPFRAAALPDGAHADAAAREIARQKRDRAADPCGRCADRACEMQCMFGNDFNEMEAGVEGAEMVVDCIACGRETGFLPRPVLRLEQLGQKTVELSWDAVEGATHYSVYGLQWNDTEPTGAALSSHVWQTEATLLRLTLEEGSSYSFQLVAWNDGERRSQPSEPVHIDL